MKVTLVSPFRTLLNIDTDVAFSGAKHFSQILKRTAAQANKIGRVSYTTKREPPPERPFTKYTHRDQEHSTWFTTPLATATLEVPLIDDMEIFAEKSKIEKLRHTQRPTRVSVDIHDNTLAVMILELEFDNKALSHLFSGPSEFEIYKSNYAAACTHYLEDHVIQPFLEALDIIINEEKDWKNADKLMRKPKEFMAFNDLEHHSIPNWNHEDEPSLWTHTIYHMGLMPKAEIKNIASIVRDTEHPKDKPYDIKQGASYVLDEAVAPTMIRMNATSQYFYCMVEALNQSQKRLMRRIADGGKRVKLSRAYARFDRQENLLTELKNEMLDFTTTLQGQAQDIFDDIQTVFRTHELISALENRSKLLRDKLQRATRNRTLVQQKMLSFILVLVGSIQVISLVIQVFGYTDNVQEDDRIPGLTDIVKNIPFDLAMSIVILALIFIALYWAIRHEKGDT